jgi:CheY-like chemotaxis protein
LEQVLLNLALNARDAMPDGGTLTIRTAHVTLHESHPPAPGAEALEPGPYLALTITDTGEGMSEETLKLAFEPFFTTKGPGKGTGLGLSMVYGVVKQSGGHILTHSIPGQGTRFEIYLPAVEGEPATRGDVPSAGPRASGEHVLLVEDDPLVRDVVARELVAAGYQVEEAADGALALELARRTSRPLDVVITDLVMPTMGGLELATELRALRPALPLLFISGHPDHETMQQLEQSGYAVLQKPFTAEELLNRLHELLARGARAGEARR